MVARIEETDLSVPGPQGPLALLQPDRRGQQLRDPLPRRRRAGGPARAGPDDRRAKVLLDENVLAEGHDYFALGNLSVSPDHRWLVYSTDTTGGERYTMRFADLETGEESPESIDRHLLRGGLGQRQRHGLLHPGRRGHAALPALAPPRRAPTRPTTSLVFEEPDDHFYLGVGRTKDDRFILCGLDSKVTSEVRVLRRRRSRRARSRSSSPGGTASSTASTTTAATPAGTAGPVPHRHQRRGRGLPPDGGPRRRARAGPHWREVIAGTARGPARRRRPLRPPRGLRARGRRDPDPGDRPRHRRRHPGRPARVAVDRVGRGQPGVRLDRPPLRVHLAGHAPLGLRPRPGHRRRSRC